MTALQDCPASSPTRVPSSGPNLHYTAPLGDEQDDLDDLVHIHFVTYLAQDAILIKPHSAGIENDMARLFGVSVDSGLLSGRCLSATLLPR